MFLIAISALPLLVLLVYQHPWLLLWSFPILGLTDAFLGFDTAHAQVGGYQLLPMDPAYFFTIVYLGICILREPRKITTILKENSFLVLFLAMVAIYIVFYTPVYGQSAVGEGRKLYGFFLFPLLALSTVKSPEQLRQFVQIVILTAALVAVAVVGVAVAHGSMIRAANTNGTVMIAFAAFAMLIHRFYKVVIFGPAIDRALLFLFGTIAIVSGQRSVWLTLGAGFVLLLWINFGRPNVVMKCAALALALFLAGGSALVYFPEIGQQLGQLFEGIVNPHADPTASWRMEGWQSQIKELQKTDRVWVGEGLGSYFHWKSRTAGEVTVAPHNGYVTLLLKFGVLGLAIYAALSAQFFVRVLAARKKIRSAPMRAYIEIGLLNVGAGHAYLLGYDFTFIQMAYFAVALAAVKLCEQQMVAEYRPFEYLPTRHIYKRWPLAAKHNF